jgi:hypothetical protein
VERKSDGGERPEKNTEYKVRSQRNFSPIAAPICADNWACVIDKKVLEAMLKW